MKKTPSRIVGLLPIDEMVFVETYDATLLRVPFRGNRNRLSIIRETVISADVSQLRLELESLFDELTSQSI